MTRWVISTEAVEHGCCYEVALVDTHDTQYCSEGQRVAEFLDTELAQRVLTLLNQTEPAT